VPAGSGVEAFRRQEHEEIADLVEDPYRVGRLVDGELEAERAGRLGGQPVLARKTLRVGGGRLDPWLTFELTVEHRGDAAVGADLVVEWNVDLAGGGGNPAAFYAVPSGSEPPTAGSSDAEPPTAGPSGAEPPTAGPSGAVAASPLRRYPHDSAEEPGRLPWLAFGNDAEGVEIRATFQEPAEVAWYPVETVSNSEAGFERQYQGSCLLLRWPLALAPGECRNVGVRFDVSSTRDHRAEETAPRP
jgi:hypothetical protein